MSADFCAHPEVGLPRPDVVYYIDVDVAEQIMRGSFGNERYENKEFQNKVRAKFDSYGKLSNWKVCMTRYLCLHFSLVLALISQPNI